jgi:hypothetical protein
MLSLNFIPSGRSPPLFSYIFTGISLWTNLKTDESPVGPLVDPSMGIQCSCGHSLSFPVLSIAKAPESYREEKTRRKQISNVGEETILRRMAGHHSD